jgi:hypothetical protein
MKRRMLVSQKGNVNEADPYKSKPSLSIKNQDDSKGTKFKYDPSNYKDSANDGNYRRLSDQLSAAKVNSLLLN